MKDGCGHVCKTNPSPDGADQTPSEFSSYAIGARSVLGASRRRIGNDIATLFFTSSPLVRPLDFYLTDLI
jgi:hypothetical protein